MNTNWAAKPLWLACMLACASSATAETFSLGEVLVTAPRPDAVSGATATVDQDKMRRQRRCAPFAAGCQIIRTVIGQKLILR